MRRRERRLQFLAQRSGVAGEQRGQSAATEIEGVGDVKDDLAVERAGGGEGVFGAVAHGGEYDGQAFLAASVNGCREMAGLVFRNSPMGDGARP